jgi:hypothetical protein
MHQLKSLYNRDDFISPPPFFTVVYDKNASKND